MGTEAISSALRLQLRPGEWILWDARPHRFESLENDRARIRDAASDELREVCVAEIRSLSYLPAAELDARLERRRTVDPDDWSLAQRRETAIREVLTGVGPTKERGVAAVALGSIPAPARGSVLARILTLAIDVATRCVLGAHAALEAPYAYAGTLEAKLCPIYPLRQTMAHARY